MSVLPIRISGDPVLHAPAHDVAEFDDSLRTLVHDMYETMDLAPGVGLAAPQVGAPLRIFVFSYQVDTVESVRGVAINPTLWLSPVDPGEPDEESESEGCLSFPGERFPLRRAHSVILQAVDLEQKPFEIRADGWLARIFQHEYDHLDGVLYLDRLKHVYARRAERVERKRGWGVEGLSWTPGDEQLDG